SFYRLLLCWQAGEYLNQLVGKIDDLETGVEQKFELNSAIRSITDLLLNTRERLEIYDDKQCTYILQLMQKLSAGLILEFSNRYPGLDDISRYTEESLYTDILNRPLPSDSCFTPTPAYKEQILQQFLKDRVGGGAALKSELAHFGTDITNEMEEVSESGASNSIAFHKYNRLLNQSENAAFLICHQASFVKDNPQKLLDLDYCREWVLGVRLDFVSETDADKSSELLLALSETCAAVAMVLPGIGHDRITGTQPSEAATLWVAMNKIKNQQFLTSYYIPKAENRQTSQTHHAGDFTDSFNRRYITFDEFKEALNVSPKTAQRYIKDNEIRMLELTSNTKWLVRDDVEAFFKKKTKR